MGRCVFCEGGKMVPAKVELDLDICGHTFTAISDGTRCDQCKKELIEGLAMMKFEVCVARALAKASESSGEAFQVMRKAIGIRAVDLAEVLSVAPETISRWENDKNPIDPAAFQILRLLVLDHASGSTKVWDALRERHAPKPLAKHVELTGELKLAS